jgi:hypothetical protein
MLSMGVAWLRGRRQTSETSVAARIGRYTRGAGEAGMPSAPTRFEGVAQQQVVTVTAQADQSCVVAGVGQENGALDQP